MTVPVVGNFESFCSIVIEKGLKNHNLKQSNLKVINEIPTKLKQWVDLIFENFVKIKINCFGYHHDNFYVKFSVSVFVIVILYL